MINTTRADGLGTQGTRASATMVLTYTSHNHNLMISTNTPQHQRNQVKEKLLLFLSSSFPCILKFCTMMTKIVSYHFNSLAPGTCGSNFKSIIYKLITQNSSLGIQCKIALGWIPHNLTYENSTLLQKTTWCHEATWVKAEPEKCHHMTSLGCKELMIGYHRKPEFYECLLM